MNTEKAFIEWKRLPRSIRYTNERYEADVWPFMTTKKIFRYTVGEKSSGIYVACGEAATEDDACEEAIAVMQL